MNRFRPRCRSMLVALLLLLGIVATPAHAQQGFSSPDVAANASVDELARKAQEECDLGRAAKERAVRLAHFQQSQTLAERAVASDDQLADAHFALFCSIGEQLRIDGESFSSVFGFRRMMAALDRTLELNPEHLDALSSKGTLLVRLPAFLGGDAAKGERMLREVIRQDPKAVNARITLAKVHAVRGDREEAIAVASEALQIAHSERRADLLPEAQATVAELRSAHDEVRIAKP
jgi:tetratricopeptide (TPR) repeat protein